MGFSYDKSKSHQEEDSVWTSYSDLFTMLSVVFLLLYVTAALRNGTFGIQKQQELVLAQRELESLRAELKVFNNLAKDHVEKEANVEEKAVYEELMGQLNLLQDEARREKDKLRAAASENEKKELALNKYQSLVKSIVDANMIAGNRIKKREDIIKKKNEIIGSKMREVRKLEADVTVKQSELQARERAIQAVHSQLANNELQLKQAFQQNRITKENMEKRLAQLREESQGRVDQIKQQKEDVARQLASTSAQLKDVNEALVDANSSLQEKEAEAVRLASEIQASKERFENEKLRLRGDYEVKAAQAKGEFDRKLAAEKLSQAELAKRHAGFAKQMAEQRAEMDRKLAGLSARAVSTERELTKAKELLNARRELARNIKNKLGAAGIESEVDPVTGDVLLAFGDEYFDTGRAELKPGMKQILEKFMPLYSKSLFEDPRISQKISSVEIVGFASPTFKGKFIDPKSLGAADRQAVDYNLDLSYFRARSIFSHIFDSSRFNFQHQKDLLPKVKVTGRSFLADDIKGRDLASGMSQKEYCSKFDCKKAQRVIIKFDLDNH